MQRYFANQMIDNSFIIDENDLYHIYKVMRMDDGDKIEIVYNHELYICRLNNSLAQIINKEEQTKLLKPNITIVIPLLKEQKMDYILQKATELGVDHIIPVAMQRCVVKLSSEKQKSKIERWEKICKEASEQSKRLDIPKISKIMSLYDLNNFEGVKLTCSTVEKSQNIKNFLKKHQNYDRIILVVGPEGGLSINEENLLKKMGFESITLGDRIMRVETVPLFLLSILNYELME